MTLNEQLKPFVWSRYSRKVQIRIETPYSVGSFEESQAEGRDLFLAVGSAGSVVDGARVDFYWLVDKTDGVIIDARFQVYGTSSLVGASEVAIELLIGKNYDQAKRISADLIDTHARDRRDIPAFPPETFSSLNLVVDAIEAASERCKHLPLAINYVAPPVTGHEIQVVEGGYPNFRALTLPQKLAVINQVMDKEVRPYVQLDAGDVTVLNFVEPNEVSIAYSGSCTSCHSSTGATLSYIQQILRAQIDPELNVIPEL